MVHLRVVDAYDTTETDGYRETMPIVHVFGRDTSYERHHIRIDGFRPYFLARMSEWAEKGEEVESDDRVVSVETEDLRGRPETAIDGEQLVRICCREPDDVRDIRTYFDDPFEADVQYDVRFLVDMGAYQWLEVPDEALDSDEPINVSQVTLKGGEDGSSTDDPQGKDTQTTVPERVPPLRVCTYDIEVQQGGSGPPVVSEDGTEQARNPITAITAHDSYTDEYRVWIFKHDSWDASDSQAAREAVEAEVGVYASPRDIVGLFCEWVTDRDFDALIGWNASTFDHPYLVNWAINNDVNSIYTLSPTRDVWEMDGDGKWINSSLKGRLLLDLLTMYKKCNVHELSSYTLSDVADAEDVDVGKLSIEDEITVPDGEPAIDYAWRKHPDVFVEYSLRDVKAAVGINEQSQQNVHIV